MLLILYDSIVHAETHNSNAHGIKHMAKHGGMWSLIYEGLRYIVDKAVNMRALA